MNFYKTEEFLESIVSHVKFTLDHNEIKEELHRHMMDKIEYYMDEGYDGREAERLTIKDMGDPEIIGLELNKEHNPIMGWIWKITSNLVVLLMVINIYILTPSIVGSIFRTSGIKQIPKENIEYIMDIDGRVEIDNRVIKFTNIVYEKNGDMNIFYMDYEKGLLGGGWTFGDIGTVKDDLGNEYPHGSGSSFGGIISRSRHTIKDFPKEAKVLTIDYDRYNRKYTVKIPLRLGEDNE